MILRAAGMSLCLCRHSSEGRNPLPAVIPAKARLCRITKATGMRLKITGMDRFPPSSFRRKPESSGLYTPFPQSENDNRGISQRTGRNRNLSNIPTSPSSASGTGRRKIQEGDAGVVKGWQVLADGALGCRAGVLFPATREWIIKTTGFLGRLFQTRLYHPALAGTPPEEGNWNPLGGLFPTSLYHDSAELAERPASL